MSYLYPSLYYSRRIADIEVESALRRSKVATEIAIDKAYTADALRRSRVAAEIAADEVIRSRIAAEIEVERIAN